LSDKVLTCRLTSLLRHSDISGGSQKKCCARHFPLYYW
jgi:hypothetical protein